MRAHSRRYSSQEGDPNDRARIRLAASVVIEQNDEWLVGRRYFSAHSLEPLLADAIDHEEQHNKIKRGGARAHDSLSR